MHRILVTGTNGFVGNHLVKELAEHGLNVIGVGGPHSKKEIASYVDEYLTLDLLDKAALGAINFRNVDSVIHLAGLASVGPSFDDPMRYITTNIGLETNLFEAALTQGARPRFLVISSGSVYNPKAPLPLIETSAVLPNSPYTVSKLGQEQMAQYYYARGFECIIARPFNHIGPGQGLGFIVPDLLDRVVRLKPEGELLVGNLAAQRDYTDVRDIVRAYRLLLEKGKPGEIYNVCSGVTLSGHQILSQILEVTGKKVSIKQDPAKMRPIDSPILFGSHAKITKDTGWKPKISIETTVADTVNDWQSCT